ncbi:MAG: hypothetical protein ACRDKF_12910 [Actinomycetota bacterium]
MTTPQRTGEMIQAAQNRDFRAFETAYQLRGSELGTRTFRWVPGLWFKTMKVAVILVAAWSIGIVLHLPVMWGAGVIGMALFDALHWHVLRIARLTMIVGALSVGMLALGLVTNAFCTMWLCPG